jgi:hypothetical protein
LLIAFIKTRAVSIWCNKEFLTKLKMFPHNLMSSPPLPPLPLPLPVRRRRRRCSWEMIHGNISLSLNGWTTPRTHRMFCPIDEIPWPSLPILSLRLLRGWGRGGQKVQDKTRMRIAINSFNELINILPRICTVAVVAVCGGPGEDVRLRNGEVKLLLDLRIEARLQDLEAPGDGGVDGAEARPVEVVATGEAAGCVRQGEEKG